MTDNWADVAKAVREARRSRRWSLRDACAVAGISPTTWINAEKGMKVSDLSATAIAQAFGWPDDAFAQLLDGATVSDLENTEVSVAQAPEWAVELLEQQRLITRTLERIADQLEADEVGG